MDKKFGAEAIAKIGVANSIIEQFKGYSITIRQLYYQFVAHHGLPNVPSEYNKLATLISDARLAGLVSWDAIEDRTRNLRGQTYYKEPADVIKAAKSSYMIDKWADQDWRPEVWVEKDAQLGNISRICEKLGVDYFACRGYNSQSEQWRAGQRFASYVQKGQRPIVFHLGDHDPSGIDMTRDNQERLSLFAGVPIIVARLALNMNQVEQYAPPPNPAKLTDSRATDYIAKFGDESWELDALSPKVIADLIETNVLRVRDEKKWDAALAREAEHLDKLDRMIEEMGE